ncbi:MAG: hypothetical protein JWO30_1216 [Fibrobacteres bacterium]|nr:hypothetical protein [Fibrobacterota bacterium]
MLPKLSHVLIPISLALGLFIAVGSADAPKASAPKAAAPKTSAPATTAPATAAPVATAEAPVTAETIVYLGNSGSRYHVKGCKYLKNAGKPVAILTAMKQGYAPCNVCKAPHLKRD